MGNLRLYGSTSGYVEIAPPAVGGSQVLTLPTDSVQPGMVLVNKTDFTNAATIQLNNCFTSTYDHYRVVCDITSGSTTNLNVTAQMSTSGTAITTGYYFASFLSAWNTTPLAGGSSNGSSWGVGYMATSGPIGWVLDFINPLKAQRMLAWGLGANDNVGITYGGYLQKSAGCDGFKVATTVGTITGTIRIYGFRNA